MVEPRANRPKLIALAIAPSFLQFWASAGLPSLHSITQCAWLNGNLHVQICAALLRSLSGFGALTALSAEQSSVSSTSQSQRIHSLHSLRSNDGWVYSLRVICAWFAPK